MLWLAIPCMIMSHSHAQETPPAPDDTADDVEEIKDDMKRIEEKIDKLK